MRLLSAVVVGDFLGVTRNFWKERKVWRDAFLGPDCMPPG